MVAGGDALGALALDLVGAIEQLLGGGGELGESPLIEDHPPPADVRVATIEPAGCCRRADVTHRLVERGADHRVLDDLGHLGPGLVGDPYSADRPVVVLDRTPALARMRELQQTNPLEHPYVVADVAQGGGDLLGNFAGARRPILEHPQDRDAQRMGEGLHQARIVEFGYLLHVFGLLSKDRTGHETPAYSHATTLGAN